jgi:sugar (pentulose or hexulose) kinase
MIYTNKAKKTTYILAIDLGSTNIKAAIFDSDLKRIGESSIPMPYLSKDIKKFEFDVDTAWNLVLELFKNVCKNSGLNTKDVKTISIDSQNGTFTILDSSGKPVLPFISWLDGRAEDESEILSRRFGSEFYRYCGIPVITPFSDISKFLWIRKNHPDLLSDSNTIYPFPSYITYKFIGVNAIDTNLGAMYGLYSLKIGDWRSDLMDFIGIKRKQIPIIVSTGTPIKALRVSKEIDLSPDLEVVLSGNDQTAAAFGNLVSKGRILIGLGTALMVYRYMGERKGPYNKNSMWGPYPGGGYYEMYANNYGTHSLDWARNYLLPGKNIIEFNAIAQLSIERELKTKEVFFYPQRMGRDDAWVGDGDLRDRALAVFEGISFYLRYIMLEYLKINLALTPIWVTGGGSNNTSWLKVIANVLDTKVYKASRDALSGAARMVLPNKEPENSKNQKIVAPEQSKVLIYNSLYKVWVRGLKKSDYI